jgi:uncharacterized protein YjbJ (UPF0337 family)
MEWDQVENNWESFKGKVKQQWSEISTEQLNMIAGNRERLVRVIQRSYTLNQRQAEQQLDDWQSQQINIDGHFYDASMHGMHNTAHE